MLRVSGKSFDAATYAEKSEFRITAVHIRGKRRSPNNPRFGKHTRSGITVEVSRASFSNLKRQVKDAVRFLEIHGRELRRLLRVNGVEDATLDFGLSQRPVAAQFDYFPPELVRTAGELGIGIEVSHYAIEES